MTTSSLSGMNSMRFLVRAAVIAACCLLMLAASATAQVAPSPPSAAAGAAGPAPPAASSPQDAGTTSLLEEVNLQQLWSNNSLMAWLLLILAIFLGLVAGKISTAVLGRLGEKCQARGWTVWTHLVTDLIGPANLVLLTFALSVGLGLADVHMAGALQKFWLSPALQKFWSKTILLLYYIAVFWYAYNLAALVDVAFRRLTAGRQSILDKQFAPLVRKTLRTFLVVLGITVIVGKVFGQDVGAWLAGLGIAGLAISLAAQDSLRNLFGSITILLDRPFQIGDRIVYGGCEGVIEEIGFRSTKVRTLPGHLVTIPNSKIVNDPVENVSRRPYIRRVFNVTLSHNTPRDKIEQAVQVLRNVLEEEVIGEPIHAIVDGTAYPPRVHFHEFSAESLSISVTYWFTPPVYSDYLEHAQKVNLRIFEEFQQAGIQFTLPPQPAQPAGAGRNPAAGTPDEHPQ